MKGKKAQVRGILIFLVVIILILLTVILTYVAIKTRIISVNTNPNWNQPQVQQIKEVVKVQEETVCYSPYVKLNNICCLDQNFNSICDNYEQKETKEPESKCYSPYIKRGSSCCLDDNRNRMCDMDEYYREEDRYDYYLNSPFDIKDIDISKDDLTLEIKNTGDEEVTIKMIDVDDCDKITPNETIPEDERESFDFDCDFPSRIDSDIEVEYMEGNSTEVLVTKGRIRENIDYMNYDYYYDEYY